MPCPSLAPLIPLSLSLSLLFDRFIPLAGAASVSFFCSDRSMSLAGALCLSFARFVYLIGTPCLSLARSFYSSDWCPVTQSSAFRSVAQGSRRLVDLTSPSTSPCTCLFFTMTYPPCLLPFLTNFGRGWFPDDPFHLPGSSINLLPPQTHLSSPSLTQSCTAQRRAPPSSKRQQPAAHLRRNCVRLTRTLTTFSS